MVSRLIALSLTQRVLMIAGAALLSAAGSYSALHLPIDAFPEIAPTQVKLIMKAPGMTPAEVEALVVQPLELELLGIPRQTIMRATAKYAIADITIDFQEGTDVYWARQQVSERLMKVNDLLPETVLGGLAPVSTALSELFMFTLEGGGLSLAERRSLLDWVIRPSLRTVAGVADVNSLGGRVRTFEIVPDEAAMAATGVNVSDLRDTLLMNNRNDGAGRIVDGEEALVVRSLGAAKNATDLAALVVRNDAAGVVRLGDVATVQLGSLTRYGSVTRNGAGETVEGIVVALKGADARQVVADVEARLEALAPGFPKGLKINVFYNRSDLIEAAVGTVSQALLFASVLVILLLIVFLGNWRAALVVALILPLSALATFLLMRLSGLSANLMSLGGLAIAIGMIVDSAIVVTENTVTRLAERPNAGRLNVIFRATREVAAPTVAGTVIICLVFLPLLTLQGLEGRLFAPVALAIVFALASALLLAFTVIPVLAVLLLRTPRGRQAGGENAGRESAVIGLLLPRYEGLLDFSLRRPWVIYVLAALGVVAALFSYARVGKTFMPTMNEGAVVMQLTALPSINLRQSEADDLRVEASLLQQVPEVRQVISRVGSDELGLDPMGLNESDMFLVLAAPEEWRERSSEWLINEMRKAVAPFHGIESSFTQPIEMRVSELLTGSRGDLAIKIFGPDQEMLAGIAGQVEQVVREVPGAADVFTTSNDVAEYLQVTIDPERAGRFGFDMRNVQDELRARLEGVRAGLVLEPGRRTPVVIRSGGSYRDSLYGFEDAVLVSPDRRQVRLSDIASVQRANGLASVERENGSRYAVVEAFVSGRDLVGFVEEARAAVAEQISLPTGYRMSFGGEFENQQRATARLAMVVPLALSMIFLVLFITLRSLRESVLILLNIPFALVGGIIALALSGEYLSVPASVGFIALLGIAVLNGLVLVSCFNDLKALGHPLEAAVRLGAMRRLRPVLMTASTAAFGLAPLLFASGPGSEIQRPLAIVVIGGLVSSTLLTLFLLPLLYRWLGRRDLQPLMTHGPIQWHRPYAS